MVNDQTRLIFEIPDHNRLTTKLLFCNLLKGLKYLAKTMNRMTEVLHWNSWAMAHKIELMYSFSFVLRQMWGWSNSLAPDYLQTIFALSSISQEK